MNALFDLDAIGRGLPFATATAELTRALDAGACVVQAPPGTGKTTLAPPLVANWLAERGDAWRDVDTAAARGVTPGRAGRVIVTQPRRVAVRAAARRLAQLTGTRLGDVVGYAVRGESRSSTATLVEFVTPGLLDRRLLADPELTGVGAVILDEVHERSIESDVAFGLLADVRALRDDLVVVAMSATLDAPRFADLLAATTTSGEAPLVDCPSALHPLDVRWAPFDSPRLDARGVTRAFLEHVARITTRALDDADTHAGGRGTAAATDAVANLAGLRGCDALVFLPGAREVSIVAEQVRQLRPELDVLELHGRIDAAEQDRATAGRGPGEPRRVVVSTALAESSLTVPGVRLVVDAGLSREPRRDVARGMNGLVTVACSRASAVQRAGRAARLGPGMAVRCYDEQTFARMPEHVTPEMATSDLTDVALTFAAWGTPGGTGLSLPTQPPAPALREATHTLVGLGALDADGRITALGRTLVEVPADPRLARALLVAAERIGARSAAEYVAALADDVRSRDADLDHAIAELQGAARSRWVRESERLTLVVAAGSNDAAATPDPGWAPGHAAASRRARSVDAETESDAGLVIALAYPERVAHRVAEGVYLTASGTRAGLDDSPLTECEWLAVADVARSDGRAARGTGAVIRLAAPITRQIAEDAAAHLLVDEVRATWDATSGKIVGRRVKALGAIEFSATPTSPTPEVARQAVANALAAQRLSLLTWSDAAAALRRRLAFLHHHLADPWPAMDDDTLLARLDEWLAPELDRLARGGKLASIDLTEPLRRLLPWPEATRLDELAPERLRVPSGSSVRITYPPLDEPGGPPIVAVKLQECFGLTQTPRLADGRAPVLFHLLSPAQRPVAVTDDLASFWAGPYAGVRADMRGRYPKHPWPEDPLTHVATAKTKNRL
ncbi:ATP-dependent helicase HrpB [Dermacoccus sp. Ellin185]|uniref:ATP-dependent helicase HrpB n=1 Tax=Dermacoccus sp. Ellin185 TaxID=188626 RepID=UPI0001E6432B|nr:ATP-dependent helicase HrpB [Dermacoccus sp. Ellin185]EFP57953.1 ATP-dependent helicase HrpB [Dermacoccus sp. Ellin185]